MHIAAALRHTGTGALNNLDSEGDFEDTVQWKDETPHFLRSKSNVARIEELIDASGSYSDRAVQLLVAQEPSWIDREALKRVVVKQRQRFIGCLSLPFSLMFFMIFAFNVFMHEDITMVYVIESGMRSLFLGHSAGQVGVSLEEVNSITDVWDWVNTTLAPKLFDQTDLLGRPVADKSLWSWVLMYNQLQGPMVLEQSRAKRELCQDLHPGSSEIVDGMMCYPKMTDSDEWFGLKGGFISDPKTVDYAGNMTVSIMQRQKYYHSAFFPQQDEGRRLRIVDNSYEASSANGQAFKVFIYPNTPKYLIQEHLNYLRFSGWLDESSKHLKIKGLLLNAEVGRPRLEQLIITFIFSRGGGVYSQLNLNTLFLEFYPSRMVMLSDFVWSCMLAFITFQEIRSVWKMFRRGEIHKKLTKFKTLLEWIIIIGGYVCILSYATLYILGKEVELRYQEVIDAQVRDVPADLNTLGAKMHDATDNMIGWSSYFRIIVAEYHLVLMFRFFTAFHAQPRLGIVVSVLESSVLDIFHFFVVLFPTFLAYAISGSFIFGRRLEEFSTIEKAIGVCFKMVMEGEYNWPDISLEHYYTALFWTWTFMLLLVLLMLNMVLAIVMDTYTELRRSAGNSESVWTTIKNVCLQAWWWRVWISNKEISQKVDALKRFLTREELKQEFHGICEVQLNMLITTCDQESELGAGLGIKDSMKMTLAAKLCIDEVDNEMRRLRKDLLTKKEEQSSDTAAYKPGPPNRGWLQEISERTAVQNHRMLSIQWQLQQIQWQWHTMQALCRAAEADGVLLESISDMPIMEEKIL